MNRQCALEHKLLARSHCPDRVTEIIAERYGAQGQSIIFSQSGTLDPGAAPLLTGRKQGVPPSTRKAVRLYIQETTTRQRSLLKLLLKHRRRRQALPLPVNDLLKKYLIPDFADFVHLHTMWQAYMQDLLFGGHAVPPLTMAARLATADFTGCIVTVVRSRDVNLVGVRGIVLWDAQLAFVLCVPRGKDAREWLANDRPGVGGSVSLSLEVGGLRSVPKRKTVFTFDVEMPARTAKTTTHQGGKSTVLATETTDHYGEKSAHANTDMDKNNIDVIPASNGDGTGKDMDVDVPEISEREAGDADPNPEIMTFSIIGLRFEARLADRLGRKFKNHNIDDIY